jgi:hypothetical protein
VVVQKLKDTVDKVLKDVTAQAELAARPLRSELLAHLADLGTPPDPETDTEALTWWAARLLCIQAREKLEARSPAGLRLCCSVLVRQRTVRCLP